MIRTIFSVIIVLHGLIHLFGFAKAFRPESVKKLTLRISRPAGIMWLCTGLVLIAAASALFLQATWWWMIAAPAAAASQVLVVMYWPDARFGTIANAAILIAVVIGFGAWRFDAMTRSERLSLLAPARSAEKVLTEELISGLPSSVRTWLKRTRLIGRKTISTVRLLQTGDMRTSPEGKWMPVKAEQWIMTDPPGFIWNARVAAVPMVYLAGRDLYLNGRGRMLISVMSLFPVVNAGGGKIDQASMLRFLGEMACYPSAALNDYLRWESLGPSAARAVMTYGGVTASGIFRFDGRGDLASFEARRFYEGNNGAILEDWLVTIDPQGFREFDGLWIPTAFSVTWRLKKGDFTWFRLKITDIEFNPAEGR